MHLIDILFRHREEEKAAVIYNGQAYSYKQLCITVEDKTEQLKGVRGTNIGIYFSNSIEFVIFYFVVANLKLTPVVINVSETAGEIRRIIEQCEIKTILTNGVGIRDLDVEFIGDYVKVVNVDFINEKLSCTGYESRDESSMKSNLILHTTGTTSSGKNVILPEESIIANIEGNIEALEICESDISLILLPMTYCYCNIAQFLSHLYVGATVVIYSSLLRDKYVLKTLAKYDCTNVFCVPGVYTEVFYSCLERLNRLEKMRFITIGGDKISKAIVEKSIECLKTIKIALTYGMTEAGPRISTYFPNLVDGVEDTVGKPIKGCIVEIANEDENGEGEIVVSGKCLMKGYFNNKEETEKVLKDGKIYTGDIGYIDDNGYIHVTGRYKNLIISGGRNICPEEIEKVLESHCKISEAVVVGGFHEIQQEIPIAYIVLKEKFEWGRELITELQMYCKGHLSAFKVPVRFYAVPQIVRNKNGKKDRGVYKMKEKVVDILQRNSGYNLSREDISRLLSERKCDLKDDFGIDSFGIVKVIIDIEEEFNVEFDMEKIELVRLRKFSGLIETIEECLEKGE